MAKTKQQRLSQVISLRFRGQSGYRPWQRRHGRSEPVAESFTLRSTADVPTVTSLLVSITNSLFAFGTSATVAKNLALVEVTTAPIPEPTSVFFLLAGLGLVVAFVARRRLE